MTVYIVFGDDARSDGDNIAGVFRTMEAASKKIKELADFNAHWGYTTADWTIEEFTVEN